MFEFQYGNYLFVILLQLNWVKIYLIATYYLIQ